MNPYTQHSDRMHVRHLFLYTCLSLTAVAIAQDETAEHDATPYTLVWADEFDTPGRPDPNRWTYKRGFVRNEEYQWYQPENASCDKGFLIIEGRRERVENPSYDERSRNWKRNRKHAEYTSSSLMTRGLHSWTYGRFEMRARFATQAGLWPVFWTLGSARAWPGCGEIDIMEYYRGHLLANACWAGERRWTPIWDSEKKPVTGFNDPHWEQRFHVWRMDWDRHAIRLYVDGLLLNTIELGKTINRDGEGKNPFHEPHYLLVSLAIGGTNGGDPTETSFPTRYEIDYVRVYQKTY